MRISDWSSDVCSSDLAAGCGGRGPRKGECRQARLRHGRQLPAVAADRRPAPRNRCDQRQPDRSAESGDGKECVSTSRSRWTQEHKIKETDKSDRNDKYTQFTTTHENTHLQIEK